MRARARKEKLNMETTLDRTLPQSSPLCQEGKVLRPPRRYGLVRLGDIIPEVIADLKARCEREKVQE